MEVSRLNFGYSSWTEGSAQGLGKANYKSQFSSDQKAKWGRGSRRGLKHSHHQVYVLNKMLYGIDNGRSKLRAPFLVKKHKSGEVVTE